MTVPATDWFTLGHVANANHASGSPDWDTDQMKIAIFADATFSGTPNMDTCQGYGVTPFTSGNGEVTGTGWATGGVNLTGNITVASSGHKVVYTMPQHTVGPGVILPQFRLGLIYDSAQTTKWGLVYLSYGTDFTLAVGDTLTFTWASSPLANTIYDQR